MAAPGDDGDVRATRATRVASTMKPTRLCAGRIFLAAACALLASSCAGADAVDEVDGESVISQPIRGGAIDSDTTAVFAMAVATGGWANVWAGRALRRHRPQGRTGALVLALVNLFVLPFGTALAIYTFWVLLHNEVRALFESAATERAPAR